MPNYYWFDLFPFLYTRSLKFCEIQKKDLLQIEKIKKIDSIFLRENSSTKLDLMFRIDFEIVDLISRNFHQIIFLCSFFCKPMWNEMYTLFRFFFWGDNLMHMYVFDWLIYCVYVYTFRYISTSTLVTWLYHCVYFIK